MFNSHAPVHLMFTLHADRSHVSDILCSSFAYAKCHALSVVSNLEGSKREKTWVYGKVSVQRQRPNKKRLSAWVPERRGGQLSYCDQRLTRVFYQAPSSVLVSQHPQVTRPATQKRVGRQWSKVRRWRSVHDIANPSVSSLAVRWLSQSPRP